MSGEAVKTNMVVYGCNRLGYELGSTRTDETDTYVINYWFLDECPNLNSFDVVFLNYNVLDLELLGSKYKPVLLRRYKELTRALEAGKTVCILYYRLPTPREMGEIQVPARYYEEEIKKRWRILAERNLAQMILTNYFGLVHKNFDGVVASLRTRRSEFQRFVDTYSVAESYFDHKFAMSQIICEIRGRAVGLVIDHNFIVLPFSLGKLDEDYVKEGYRCLAEAILSYKARAYYEPPGWAEELTYPSEEGLREKEAGLRESLEKIREKQEKYFRFKQILFLGDDPLVEAVTNFFEEGLGIETERQERFEEDFWLIINGERIALAEVKGLNADVKRSSVGNADNHREANGLSPNFPALLIANTFLKGVKSLSDKDKPIASDIRQHAVRNNVLVVRALDLARVLYLIESGIKTKEEFLDVICSHKGWLCVTMEDWKVMKK